MSRYVKIRSLNRFKIHRLSWQIKLLQRCRVNEGEAKFDPTGVLYETQEVHPWKDSVWATKPVTPFKGELKMLTSREMKFHPTDKRRPSIGPKLWELFAQIPKEMLPHVVAMSVYHGTSGMPILDDQKKIRGLRCMVTLYETRENYEQQRRARDIELATTPPGRLREGETNGSLRVRRRPLFPQQRFTRPDSPRPTMGKRRFRGR